MASTIRDRVPTEPFVTADDDGEALWSVGASMIVKADAETTGGASTLIDHLAPPGNETPSHVTRAEDEVFYVLEGERACHHGEGGAHVVHAGPNDTVFLPRDVPHGFRVVSDDPCRTMIGLPPSCLEAFFAAAGGRRRRWTPHRRRNPSSRPSGHSPPSTTSSSPVRCRSDHPGAGPSYRDRLATLVGGARRVMGDSHVESSASLQPMS